MDTDTLSYPLYLNKLKESLDDLSFIEKEEEDQCDLNFLMRAKSSSFNIKEQFVLESTDDLSTLVSSLYKKEECSEMSSIVNSSNGRKSKQLNMKGRVLVNSLGFEAKSNENKVKIERVSCVFK